MYNLYLAKGENIAQACDSIRDNTWTWSQFRSILNIFCAYEVQMIKEVTSVLEASRFITETLKNIESGAVKRRSTPYKFKVALAQYQSKYPEAYASVRFPKR